MTNGNYGGNYNICFTPTSASNTATVCDNGLVNVYVQDGGVEIVGLWDAEVLTGDPERADLSPPSKTVAGHRRYSRPRTLIVSGEINGDTCTVRVDGYSTDPLNPGDFSGRIDTTRR